MTTAYIALGSNLGDPARQLQEAALAISALPETRIIARSPLYRSAAVGPGEQPPYLNAVLSVHTELPAQGLLDALQSIENRQGRVRTQRWGARTLDLDILLYGDERIDTPTLQIPHPAMHERHFVLYPLADIAPPTTVFTGQPLSSWLALCPRAELEQLGSFPATALEGDQA